MAHQTLLLGNLILGAAGIKGRRLRLDDVLLRFDSAGTGPDVEQAIEAVIAALSASGGGGGVDG